MFVVPVAPCGFSSITGRRCASGPGSGNSCTSWFWPSPMRPVATARTRSRIFTNSWKDRPTPALASEMPSVRIVDVKLPVRALLWSWNRLEWPPVEWFAGTHDVVHSQSPLLIPASRAAQVVTVHDLDFLRHPDQMSAEIRRDYPALARSHAARADGVIVSSQYAAGEVTRELQLDPSRVHVCPPGRPSWADAVQRRRSESRLPGEAHSVHGHAEPAEERRHAARSVRSAARQRAGRPAADACGPSHAGIGAMGSALPSSRHCGATSPSPATWIAARKIDLYADASMLVLPSYEEGFGLPVLEAMACGVPVIVSSRGSLPEVAGAAATPIDPDDADGFALAMQALLRRTRRKRAHAASRRRRITAGRRARRRRAAPTQSAIEVHARRH